jgi:ribonuclease P protein component
MQKNVKHGFGKKERLHGNKDIQELFDKGSSFYVYPLRVRFLPEPKSDGHRVLISVSRRSIRHASSRNLLKRRMREAYRLNKGLIADVEPLRIAYIYTSREILPFRDIERSVLESFKKLKRRQ